MSKNDASVFTLDQLNDLVEVFNFIASKDESNAAFEANFKADNGETLAKLRYNRKKNIWKVYIPE